ncbi:isochorismate synthase [Rodentibacter heidelbergensis]|uniref:Isochorismate synthase MenF n=1 Tax=Rodentibacter heidelbergensis TaxID=1908258 RepID=A0A1V3I6G1_9PAST|nr:isochorismate synthase [Rodentibacter heidelbergensis]OOF35574.1 isochorismate synthase [Rodentibacter heidelbergensis]
MGSLEQAASQLSLQIEQYLQQGKKDIERFQVNIANINLLAWLKSQTTYPQFYLHFRDENKSMAALGEVRKFTSLNLAQEFIEASHFPLVGGLQFQGSGQFILPQLLLETEKQNTIISCFVEGETSAQRALAQLKTLPKMTALCPLPKQIPLHTEQQANQPMWCDWVNQALYEIKQGELTKLVLANETVFHLKQPVNPYNFLAESEKQNQGCYHFLWAENPHSTFIGSTPERLFAREYNLFLTEALAGTAPITADLKENQQQAQWLLNDEKNLNENWLVVQDISQNIQAMVESFDVSEVELKPLRKVQHLLRKIRANLSAHYRDSALLKAIHPTAAVSGLPQQQARMILSEIETFDRGWYAGTLGVMSEAYSEFCVAIRSAFIERNRIRVFAGAGIVEGSEPLAEWQEIERKASGLISLFAENNDGEKECL